MSKQNRNSRKPSNISWNLKQQNELQRAVKNFNAKVSRLEKKYPELKHILPEKVDRYELFQMIDTRQDLKREVNALKRFTSRDNKISKNPDGTFTGIVKVPGNEYNMKTTKWQKEEMTRRVPVINKRREERRKMVADIDMSSRGKKLGYKKGYLGMGKVEERELDPIVPFTPKQTRTALNMKFRVLISESRSRYWNMTEALLKANYIIALQENYNVNDIEDIIASIDDMDPSDFYKIFLAEDLSFEESYPPDEEGYKSNLKQLRGIWKPVKKPNESAEG